MIRNKLQHALMATIAGVLLTLAGAGSAVAIIEDNGSEADLPSSLDQPVCVNSGHRIVVVRSYDSETAGYASSRRQLIRNRLARMNWKVMQQAQLSGGPPLELKVECDTDGLPKVYESFSDGEVWQDWQQAAKDLFEGPDGRLPAGAEAIKILVLRDEQSSIGRAPVAPEIVKSASDDPDGFKGAEEANNYRVLSSFAIAARGLSNSEEPWGDHTALHELFHSMGAVAGRDGHDFGLDDPAPFANGSGHCNDGIDMMCYSFGNSGYTSTRCPLSEGYGTPEGLPIDCGFDTYFDAAPEAGEWLDRHWNVGGAENPYLYRPPGWLQANRTWLASKLQDVHCTSSTACVGIGFESRDGRKVPLAAHWDGSAWTKRSTPVPTESGHAPLRAVSCMSASSCVAVGLHGHSVSGAGGELPFVLHWDGSSWSEGALPGIPFDQAYRDLDVSCYVVGCVAVGGYTASPNAVEIHHSLAYRWDGTSWTVLTVPTPAGSTGSGLTEVHCASATSCRTVGWHLPSGGERTPMFALLDSAGWSHQAVPAVTGALWSELSDLACSSTSCAVVGQWREASSGLRKPLAMTGPFGPSGSWSVGSVPVPTGATRSGLSGVACGSGSSCVAVGHYVNSAGKEIPLRADWNGSGWSLGSAGGWLSSSAAGLAGVSCWSSSGCLGVGQAMFSSGDFFVAIEFDGSGASVGGNGVPDADARAVSCAQPKACVSIGVSDGETVGRSWNGDRWSSMPAMASVEDESITSLQCTASDACVAVGSQDDGADVLVERWDGSAWTTQSASKPAASSEAALNDVSCPAASACVAVGAHRDSGSVRRPLVEAWDGSAWTVQAPIPVPTGATTSELTGVSCVSASACTAVGNYQAGSGDRYFAVRWNGTAWTLLSLSGMPSGATSARLEDLVCLSATSCPMVGSYQTSSGRRPLYITSVFGTYGINTWVTPAGATDAELADIAHGNGKTVAVGDYTDATGSRKTYATRANGSTSGTIELTPNAPAQSDSQLDAVSCTAAGTCMAAGKSSGPGIDSQPLYNHYE
ncbi:MAG TPA: hypothetical protein VHF90_01915 [Thermoleophilaceae bacterium]|nr:hypothetical protein [Thermoleophilaceae bacterium]